jgi:hypothetical protein
MTANDDRRPVVNRDSARPHTADYRLARRAQARRQALRRRRRVAGLTLAAVVTVTVLWVGGGSHARRSSSAPKATRAVAARTSPQRITRHTHAVAPSPGSLPQTHAYPSGTSPRFKSLMASLWAGIMHDSVVPALAAFFPKDAYRQLKAIASAGSDWTNRLVHDYALDITAAHALLGGNAARARLIAVDVPSTYGHWIPPGVCYNRMGYYEMPNARIVYHEDGQIRSFGIASMISWRGVWYVVHLGAILRSSDSGVVDDPASGPGTPVASVTC